MKRFLILILSVMVAISAMIIPASAEPATFDVCVSSSDAAINFREGPSTSSRVMTEIPNGEVLTIYQFLYVPAEDLFFGLTRYHEVPGWISLRQTSFLTEVPAFDARVTSSENSINFRSDASTGSPVIMEIPNGTMLRITSMRYNSADDLFFGFTEYNGIAGWVSLRQMTPTAQDASAMNITPGGQPGNTTGNVQGGQFGNTAGNVQGGQFGDAAGYAPNGQPGNAAGNTSGAAVLSIRTDVGFNGVVTVRSENGGANFRPVPSTSSAIIRELPNNTILTIYDIVQNEDLIWGYTENNGTYGWVSLRQTVTPGHPYQMPDYIRDWDGNAAAADGSMMTAGADTAAYPASADPFAAYPASANPASAYPSSANDALYRNYSYNYALGKYENAERIMIEGDNRQYVYELPEARIRFTSIDVGQPEDFPTHDDWPHYAVIEHYDESGAVLWSITTDNVYSLNGGYFFIGASPDVFFYTNIEDIFAIEIATGAPVWTVKNEIGGIDGAFSGKAVGKSGEVYICTSSAGTCMVINAGGEVVHRDKGYIGPNLVFTDIHYTDNNMISVTAQNDDGRKNQFMISRDDL